MLEQARFSLARAGVMVGLCGLLVLGSGWLMNQNPARKVAQPVHFSAQTWQQVQAVLSHLRPAVTGSSAVLSPGLVSTCQGHPRLLREAEVLQGHLAGLQRTQFVKQLYQLDLSTLPPDPQLQTCADLVKALRWINDRAQRQGIEFWASLAWKERLRSSAQARLEPHAWVSMPKQMLSTRSAWAGLAGCVYGTDVVTGQPVVAERAVGATARFCKTQSAAVQALGTPAPWPSQIPALSVLLEPLAAWRLPQHDRYSETVGDANTVLWSGQKQALGLHAQLSIDPQWQADLQTLAECFSGRDLPLCGRYVTQAQGRYENARVRMVGISVVDVASGRVVAAASANSPCHAHDKTRIGEPAQGCPVLPAGTVHRPHTPQPLSNHALFTQAPPGSLVKPVLMAGIVQYAPAEASLVGLEQALQRSDSSHFLDALLCRRQLGRGEFALRCDRPALAQRIAHQLGWNNGCEGAGEMSLTQCGMVDLLYGMPMAFRARSPEARLLPMSAPSLAGMMGQTLVAPVHLPSGSVGYKDMSWPDSLPSPEQRQACAHSGARGYVRCRGDKMGLVSEAYGQGNTLSTPIGVAGLLAVLASSAQGQAPRYPHLLVDWIRADGQSDPQATTLLRTAAAQGPEGIDPRIARRVIAAMETTLLPGGTAHEACARVMGPDACRTRLGIAGKTGTPGDADDRSLTELVQDMQQRSECLARGEQVCSSRYPLPRPRYRWYAALFKSPGSASYDKAMAVLVHSNWRRSDGRYADDQNAAAEIAMWAIRQFQTPSVPQ